MASKFALLEKLAEAGPDAKVLDYHDVLLRAADVELLAGPYWCNDQLSDAVITAEHANIS